MPIPTLHPKEDVGTPSRGWEQSAGQSTNRSLNSPQNGVPRHSNLLKIYLVYNRRLLLFFKFQVREPDRKVGKQ